MAQTWLAMRAHDTSLVKEVMRLRGLSVITWMKANVLRTFEFLRHSSKEVIAFDELKTDYKNPIDQCNSLNPLVLPEYLLHLLFNLLFLFSGEWFSLCVNIPLIAYHINRYRTRPVMTGPGLYDPTSIMNSDVLTKCQREGWIKLAFYLLSFFYYLYGMIYSLIST
uniref:Protein cornichon n=1 Tax=Timema monikensis TaxID=170555 RepID=A0A7R9E6M3_9NEOP|nr:unnamed protein product [Timema monikensis]